MYEHELKRLKKLEKRIYEIARENGLVFRDIEFDVVPAEKMFEIMAYGMPGQISSWKYGRDYEKTRTIYEKMGVGLPYEVVVNTDPARAYLMKDNTIALQALIIAHVVGHVAFFTMNKYHAENDENIASRLANASKRFEEYERKYGIDIVEETIDAGHALMLHSTPWLKEETESEKLERLFERMKQRKHDKGDTEFGDFFEDDTQADIDREKWNHRLYMTLKKKTPVQPTEDLLRYIIDHSRNLADWQKDILEVVRSWGQYVWPNIKTKYMNEGFATYWHEKILRQLFNEKLLTAEEHAECNYSNSLVKAMSPFSMNPYLIGCEIWEDVVKRWNKGRHGNDWHDIQDHDTKINFDNKAMKGMEQMFKVLRTSNDWMFMNNFLTNDLVKKLKLYMYVKQSNYVVEELVITDHQADEIRQIIIKSFSNGGVPRIFVTDGNYLDSGELYLKHEHIGMPLHPEYSQKTLEHIRFLWGEKCTLETIKNKSVFKYTANKVKDADAFDDTEYLPPSELANL
jgi:stage V sporulation protein R